MTAKRQWTLLTALACLVVLVAGYMLLVRPQHSKAAATKTQTAGVQSQITTLRAQLARLTEESHDLAGQQAQLANIAKQLPTDPALPSLLRTLDKAAKTTDVELVNVAPGNPAAFTASTATAGTAAGGTTAGGTAAAPAATAAGAATGAPVTGLAQIPVVLTVSGGYFQMERFLDSVEGLQRSMLVNSFTLAYAKTGAPASGSAPTVGQGPITATINAQAFMSTAALGTAASSTPAAGSATANRVPTAS